MKPFQSSHEETLFRLHRSRVREREKDLGYRLGLPVTFDETGLLCRDVIEIAIVRAADGTIRPVGILVGLRITDAAILNIHSQCNRYNESIRRLRQLKTRLKALVDAACVELHLGSRIHYIYVQLEGFDNLLMYRQQRTMGRGAVPSTTLDRETNILTDYEAQFSTVVVMTMRARPPRCGHGHAALTLQRAQAAPSHLDKDNDERFRSEDRAA